MYFFSRHLFHVHLTLSKQAIMNKPFGVDMCVCVCVYQMVIV